MIYAAIDPGVTGAIAFYDKDKMSVFRTPVKTALRSGKNRKDFDTHNMVSLFRQFGKKKIIAVQEYTHAMPNNGAVSMYFFGRGAGLWEGIMSGCDVKYYMITPQCWKSFFPELFTQKTKSPKNASESQKKQVSKQNKEAKALSKEKARKLASKLYPYLSDEFLNVNSDGKAEAVLMVHYLFNNIKTISNRDI